MADILLCVLFVFKLLTFDLMSAENGVCTLRNESGVLEKVCCADFEEKSSKCEPCPTGYTSDVGQLCRPCPQNTFGNFCLAECDCNEWQRCDNKLGCIDRGTTESPYDDKQTRISTQKDFTSLSYTTSDRITSEKASGFSAREVIVYYTLSLAVVILMVGLCFVIIKNKRGRRKRRAFQISTPGLETTNQIFENNEQSEMVYINEYEEIDDAAMIDINVKTDITHNDYLEVVAGSESSKSSYSGQHELSGYLNPYQPFVQTADTKHSYERLQSQTIVASAHNKETHIVLQDETSSGSLPQFRIPISSYVGKRHNIVTIEKSNQIFVKGLKRNNDGNESTTDTVVRMVTSSTFRNRCFSESSSYLRRTTFFNSLLAEKYKTF